MIKELMILFIIIIIYLILFNRFIKIRKYQIITSKIPFNVKIVQISDVHKRNAKKIYPLVNKEQPDFVVISGDLFDSYQKSYTNVEKLLSNLNYPIYYVSGNHEYRLLKEYPKIKELLWKYNVRILEDEVIEYKKNNQKINIAGLQDSWFESKGLNNFELDEAYSILLTHRPELFKAYVEKGVDLVFSGHIHGGLLKLPILGAVFSPNKERFFPKYYHGIYEEKGTKMIVSNGLGDSFGRFRINVPCELVVVEVGNGKDNR